MRFATFLAAAFVAVPVALLAEGTGGLVVPDIAEGSVSAAEGLDAWGRIHEVFTHPRCINCHVGDTNVPLWQGADETVARAHGMNINAGDSRIGIEYLQCNTCHQTSELPNDVPNAAPHANMDWRLAPIEMQWTGKTGQEICEQVRNPDLNGGRDGVGLIEHITHDADVGGFITWGFDPGPGREAAPYDMQTHLDDTAIWVAAGMPCAEGE